MTSVLSPLLEIEFRYVIAKAKSVP